MQPFDLAIAWVRGVSTAWPLDSNPVYPLQIVKCCLCLQGFREQTQHWPVQPIDLAIAWLKKKSPDWVAADFGCGDARLASSVPQIVHSFDLIATAPGVTACNMADVPLGNAVLAAAACTSE